MPDPDDNDSIFRRRRGDSRRRGGISSLEGLLHDWYGDEVASTEITGHLPQAVHIGGPLKSIIQATFDPAEIKLQELKKVWTVMVGERYARMSRPMTLKDGVLVVEVDNSPCLMELQRHHKAELLKKIKATLGEGLCSKLLFTLAGRDMR